MKKNTIRWIISLMSISLIGIIAFQVYWIRISIKEKEDQFDRDINKALADVRNQIEKKEAFFFVSRISSDKLLEVDSGELNSNVRYHLISEDVRGAESTSTDKNHSINSTTTVSSLGELEKLEKLGRLKGLKALENLKEFNIKTTSNATVVNNDDGARTVISTSDSKGTTEDSLSKVKIIQRFQEKKNVLTEAINEVAFEFAFNYSSLSERLEGVKIDSLIDGALKNYGFEAMDYNFMVQSVKTDSIIQGNSSEIDTTQAFQTRFFEDSPATGIIKLELGSKTQYLLRSLWLMLFISALLTLVMIYTFSYTLRIILRQKKLSEMKSDFVNNMTHEFKTPIATISLAIDSILHPEVRKQEGELNRLGQIIKHENQRMNLQVERLLQTAMFDRNEVEFNLEKVNVHQLLQELATSFEVNLQNSDSSLSLDLNADENELLADEFHLYNAFRNIIENAIKFSEKNFNIKISSSNLDGVLVIQISDQGIGMSKETQKKIFDRFYRHTQGNLHQTKGFGLGLSYVKTIIDKLKGEIEVKSKLGAGTTFTIRIPLK